MSEMSALDFATLLRRYRRRSGLTQGELAERAGLSLGAVGLLERGITLSPQKATVDMLSAGLALPPDEASALLELSRVSRRTDEDDLPRTAAQTTLDGSLPVPLTAVIGRAHEAAMLQTAASVQQRAQPSDQSPYSSARTSLTLRPAKLSSASSAPPPTNTNADPIWSVRTPAST